MTSELNRTETAICALSANTLQPDSWCLDSVLALGLCAQKNRLGDLMIHFIDSPRSSTVMEITLIISTRLIKAGFDKLLTLDAAHEAFEYWASRHCPKCGGRGVLNFQQETCPSCGGTGERKIDGSDMTKAGVSILIEAENSMEVALRKKQSPHDVPEHKYSIPDQYAELVEKEGLDSDR